MAHDRASERATFPPSELVRLELIDRRRAAAILAGTPEPDLPWERGFPPDSLLDALRKIVAAEAAGDVARTVLRLCHRAAGTALRSGPSTAQALILFAAMGGLAMTAPLAGHAASHGPGGLLAGTDTIHVLCMCSWLGGLVMLVIVLSLGVRTRNRSEAAPLLATVVARFSRVAMIAVTLLLLSGIVNSVVLVASVEALIETPYGRLVLAKIALFSVLIALGALNQRRLLPAMRASRPGVIRPDGQSRCCGARWRSESA